MVTTETIMKELAKNSNSAGILFSFLEDILLYKLDYGQENNYTSEQLTVEIPLKEFVYFLGKDYNNEIVLKNIAKKVRKDIDVINALTISEKHGRGNYFKSYVVKSGDLENGIISVDFTQSYAKTLFDPYYLEKRLKEGIKC